MERKFALGDLLLPYVLVVVGVFIIHDVNFHFFLTYTALISLCFGVGLRLKDVNICILSILCLTPFVLETLVFSTGLISLSSSPENRLFQNSLIFGIHLIIELIVLAPLTYRTELTKKLFPRYKIKYTFADNIFPWLAILGALFTFATIVENYLRNGKGYDVTFFFYSSDIAGYILYSAKCGIMIALTALTYKEEYDYALPSLRKKR